MSAPTMAGLLEALPKGRRIWITARGRSLWPLLRGGEQLHVERCDAAFLQPGDIAVLLTPAQTLVAHVVVCTSPLATAAFNGRTDPAGWRPLGRAVGLRVGGREVPLPRRLVRTGQRAWSAVARSAPAQLAWTFFLGAWGSAGMRRIRAAALGAVDVQLAGAADRTEVIAALSMHEVLTEDVLAKMLDGATAALATSRGRAIGVALVDRHGRLVRARALRRAVSQGVEQRLVDALLSAGLREADIEGLKPPFVTALARRGFQPRGDRSWWVLQAATPTAQP